MIVSILVAFLIFGMLASFYRAFTAGEDRAAADRLVIVHTSGSTSAPKGVIHQHGPLLEHLAVLNGLRRYDETEVLFSNSPFFWLRRVLP